MQVRVRVTEVARRVRGVVQERRETLEVAVPALSERGCRVDVRRAAQGVVCAHLLLERTTLALHAFDDRREVRTADLFAAMPDDPAGGAEHAVREPVEEALLLA